MNETIHHLMNIIAERPLTDFNPKGQVKTIYCLKHNIMLMANLTSYKLAHSTIMSHHQMRLVVLWICL